MQPAPKAPRTPATGHDTYRTGARRSTKPSAQCENRSSHQTQYQRFFRGHRIGRRPMIAAMAKSGLRVTEMCQLRWRDVDVHHERLVICEAKTDAGNRHVDLSLDVMEELMAWRAERQPASPDEYVFPTARGRPRDKEN